MEAATAAHTDVRARGATRRRTRRAAVLIGRGRGRSAASAWAHAASVCTTTVALGLVLIAMAVAGGVLSGIASRDAARVPVLAMDSGEAPAGFALDTYAMPPLNVVLVQPGATPGPPPLGLPQWPAPGTAYLSAHLAEKHAVGTASPWGLVAGVIGAHGVVNPNEQFVYANPGAYTIPEEYTLGHWGAPTGFSGDNRTNHPLWQFLAVMALMLLAPALYALRTATGARSPRLQRSLDILEGFGATDTFRAQVAVARPWRRCSSHSPRERSSSPRCSSSPRISRWVSPESSCSIATWSPSPGGSTRRPWWPPAARALWRCGACDRPAERSALPPS